MMDKEVEYTACTSEEHIKAFGQYFTKSEAAAFMCSWACKNAKTMLDPAVGNGIFFKETRKRYPACHLYGYEIDDEILAFFGNPFDSTIVNDDFLLCDWERKFDAIVCNPPYHRFQSIENRNRILDIIYKNTGVRYSAYTNLYILFLLKSLYQLSDTGRLAYIIPSEFLNSKYGIPIKEKMISEKLLRAIIHFQNDDEMFFNATTTCCILLLEKAPKNTASFFSLSSLSELNSIWDGNVQKELIVSYDDLAPHKKWRGYLHQEAENRFVNLTEIGTFCSISRGIATGANDFFCMSESQRIQNRIPIELVKRCICRSADVTTAVFKEEDFLRILEADKTVWLLDIKEVDAERIRMYLLEGEKKGVHRKYLPLHRSPWYRMEQRKAAPILVSSAYRDEIKFVRNLAGVSSLTTFHSIFIKEEYGWATNLLFCYFLTPTAQSIIRENRKEMGNGLEKFQPGDLNHAKMLDITLLEEKDVFQVSEIYEKMTEHFKPEQVEWLDEIFRKYLIQ